MLNRVAERRKEMGMTQIDLGKISETGQSTVSEIESGSRIPGVDVAIRICRALNSRVEDLFYFEGEREKDA